LAAYDDFLRKLLGGARRIAVLGVGSTLRADDAAGMALVERLQKEFPAWENVRFYAGETAPENFSGCIRAFRPSHILVVDAADLGLAPGCLAQIDHKDVGGPTFCSHMLPLRIMLDYLADETGARIVLLGIQHQSLVFDGEITPPVQGTVDDLCGSLARVIPACLA